MADILEGCIVGNVHACLNEYQKILKNMQRLKGPQDRVDILDLEREWFDLYHHDHERLSPK